jgi:hypothetical protein
MQKLLLLIIFFLIATNKSYGVNYCLHPDSLNKKEEPDLTRQLKALSGTLFTIQMIKSAKAFCINPNFPVILVETEPKADAWIQVIFTNSKEKKLKQFLDYDPQITPKPFYSFNHYFYDAPLWSIKNLIWKAYLLPVKLNKKKEIKKYLGVLV